MKKIMLDMTSVTGVYSREIPCFSSVKSPRLVENFNIGIYTDTINVINVKLCMMVLLM